MYANVLAYTCSVLTPPRARAFADDLMEYTREVMDRFEAYQFRYFLQALSGACGTGSLPQRFTPVRSRTGQCSGYNFS